MNSNKFSVVVGGGGDINIMDNVFGFVMIIGS